MYAQEAISIINIFIFRFLVCPNNFQKRLNTNSANERCREIEKDRDNEVQSMDCSFNRIKICDIQNAHLVSSIHIFHIKCTKSRKMF